jgi:hypothetical protein
MKAFRPALAAGLVLWAGLVGCAPREPRERLLEERARWSVTLLSWAQAPDGSLGLSLRVSGPPRSTLDRLTVRFELRDGSGAAVGEAWRTLDLSAVERGGPEDLLLRLPAPDAAVEGIGVDSVLAPSPEQLPRIEELRSL